MTSRLTRKNCKTGSTGVSSQLVDTQKQLDGVTSDYNTAQ
jgi:hypothetical protein